MVTKIQYRKDTAANWSSANPTLASGELGYDTTNAAFKIGNGTTAWNSLVYVAAPFPSGAAVGTTDTQTLTNKTYSGTKFASTVYGGSANMVVLTATTSSTWTIPTALQVVGAPFRVTLLGGGGGGGAGAAGQTGGGAGSGGLIIVFLTFVSGQTTATYSAGAGGTGVASANGNLGTDTNFTYNGVTYTAGGGLWGYAASTVAAQPGGSATGGTLNITGFSGDYGGTNNASTNLFGNGGNAPLGLGAGGVSAAINGSNAASGYGGGGGGTKNTTTAGGTGGNGVIIIEY